MLNRPPAPRPGAGAYCPGAMRVPRAPKALRRSGSPGPDQAPGPAEPRRPRRSLGVRKLARGLGRVARLPVTLARRVTIPAALRTPTSAVLLAVIVVLLVLVILGGGGGGLGIGGSTDKGAIVDGLPLLATKNTTRIAGSSPADDAAAVALAVYPGGVERPRTVALADAGDWPAAIAATALMSPPLRAPLLLSSGGSLPSATSSALAQLAPSQVIRVGQTADPGTGHSTQISGANPYALAANVAAYVAAARGSTADNRVLIVSIDAPQYAMPAAAWSAKSGDPILFVTKNYVPPETRDAIGRLQQPRIFVFGPGSVVGRPAIDQLLKLGTVRRIGGPDPVSTALAFARYDNGDFGWGPVRPGRGLVVASDAQPVVAAAGAALSSSGTYGPLLLLDPGTTQLPQPVVQYLLDNQPGYATDPARGVYNHAWLVGNGQAISLAVQAQIDSLLEIVPVSGTTSSG
jgi:ell wall binding domain 2 (CWB2)